MNRKIIHAWAGVLTIACLLCLADQAFGQACPRPNTPGPSGASQVRTLNGRLIYHDGIRQWFELALDEPACGQHSIELTTNRWNNSLEVLRGCRVKTWGSINFSPTGYYSREIFQDVQSVFPLGACVRRSPLPVYSGLKPDKRVRAYRVTMDADYRPGDHPIVFHVTSAGKELLPWQAYASYQLTGGFVLYGLCGKGFVVDHVFGTPQARPNNFDDPRTPEDMAEFDPETAANAGKRRLHLGFDCVRAR
jgi:hypothetical protein